MRHDANNHTREVSQQCCKQRSMETVTRSQDRFSPPFHSPVMSQDKTSERFTPHKTVYVANRTIFLFLLLWLSLLDTVSHEASTQSQQAVHFFLPPCLPNLIKIHCTESCCTIKCDTVIITALARLVMQGRAFHPLVPQVSENNPKFPTHANRQSSTKSGADQSRNFAS